MFEVKSFSDTQYNQRGFIDNVQHNRDEFIKSLLGFELNRGQLKFLNDLGNYGMFEYRIPRRAGCSTVIDLHMILKCMSVSSYTIVYVTYAPDTLNLVNNFDRGLRFFGNLLGTPIITKNTKQEIIFSNGSRIKLIPSISSNSFKGYRLNEIISEQLNFRGDYDQVIKSILPAFSDNPPTIKTINFQHPFIKKNMFKYEWWLFDTLTAGDLILIKSDHTYDPELFWELESQNKHPEAIDASKFTEEEIRMYIGLGWTPFSTNLRNFIMEMANQKVDNIPMALRMLELK